MFPTCVLNPKSRILTILKLFNMKYTRDPLIIVLILSLTKYKEQVLQISFDPNPVWGPLQHIIVGYSNIFFKL